jgi:predicted aspartyl protease
MPFFANARITAAIFSAAFALGSRAGFGADPAPAAAPEPLKFFTTFTPLARNGGPVIEVGFPNGAFGKFLVDTGSDECHISEAMAKRIGISPSLYVRYVPGSRYSLYLQRFINAKDVRLAGIKFGNVPFSVLPTTLPYERDEDESIDGMIGAQLLETMALYIDSRNHRIAFIVPGKLTADDRASLGMSGASAVELKKYHRWKEYLSATQVELPEYSATVHLTSGSHSVDDDLLVDTGTGGSTISPRAAEKLGLASTRAEVVWTHATGSVPMGVARVDAFGVGTLALADRSVLFAETVKDNSLQIGGELPALLGEDILGHCTVLFDFPGRMLYLKPSLAPLLPVQTAHVEPDRLRAAIEMPNLDLHREALRWSDEFSDDYVAEIGQLQERANTAKGIAAGALYREIGTLWRLLRDKLRSDSSFLRAVTADRTYVAAHPTDEAWQRELAAALSDAGGSDAEAEALARNCAAAHPESSRAQITLGCVLMNSGMQALIGTGSPNGVSSLPPNLDLVPLSLLAEEIAAKRPSKAQVKSAEKARDEAKNCFDKGVALAPSDSFSYSQRILFRQKSAVCIDAPIEYWRGHDIDWSKLLMTEAYRDDVRKRVEFGPTDILGLAYLTELEIRWHDLQPDSYKDAKDAIATGTSDFDFAPAPAKKAAQACIAQLESLSAGADSHLAAAASATLGVIDLVLLSDDAAAEKHFRAALSADTKQVGAAHQLIRLLEKQKRWDAAIALLKERIADAEPTVQMRLLLTDRLAGYGSAPDAETQAEETETVFPANITAHMARAALLLRRGDIATLEKANQSLGKAEAGLAAEQARLGPDGTSDPQVALDSARLSLRGERTELANLRAAYLAFTGHAAEARDLLLKTLDYDPTDTAGREMLTAL